MMPGGVKTRSGGTSSDDYLASYTGKEYDASGLIYFNARYYDPALGRFLAEDPSRQGSNWYAYCGNNPINRIDPSGRRFSEDPHDTTSGRPGDYSSQPANSPSAPSPSGPQSPGNTRPDARDAGASAPVIFPQGQIERARYLASRGIPYGHIPEYAGYSVPLTTSVADCIAAMSAVTGKPLMNVPQLMDPS
jgi:RHS repeat-associated protein